MAGSKEATLIRTAGFDLGEPVMIDHLALVPIKQLPDEKKPEPVVDYLTLGEAMKLGVVVVTERSPAVVSQLIVANLGERPILLVAGDLLVGGQQDRVVAKDTIVHPGAKVAVSVFCVEQGRWHGEKDFAASDAKVPRKVREAAMLDDQDAVWERARTTNDHYNVAEDETTVAASIRASRQKVESLLPAFEHALSGSDVVGVVYVVNGKVRSLDLFQYPRLFAASRKSLLMGFLADGATEAKERVRAPKKEEVEKFVALMVDRRNQKAPADADGVAKIEGRGFKGMEFRDSALPSSAPLHNYFAAE